MIEAHGRSTFSVLHSFSHISCGHFYGHCSQWSCGTRPACGIRPLCVPELSVYLSVSPCSLCVYVCVHPGGGPIALLFCRVWCCPPPACVRGKVCLETMTLPCQKKALQVLGEGSCAKWLLLMSAPIIRSRERFPSAGGSSANRFCFMKLSPGSGIAHICDSQIWGLGSTAGCWVAPEHGKLSCNPLCSAGFRQAHQSACTPCCCSAGCSPCQEIP